MSMVSSNANMYFVMQVMVSVSPVIAVLVPDAVHAMQDMCRMQ